MDGLSLWKKNQNLSHDSLFWSLSHCITVSKAPFRKNLSSAKEKKDGCPPYLPASSVSNTRLLAHQIWSLVSLHTATSAWGAISECACVGESDCCCHTVLTEFSQLPGWLPKTMRLNFPPLSSVPLRIFPSGAFHLAQVKLCLPAFPFQNTAVFVLFFQTVLALNPCTVTTDSWSCWSPLFDSRISGSSALCSSAQTLLPRNT